MSTKQNWFSNTASIQSAVTLINGVDNSKLNRLLARIISSIHLKNEQPFTDEENEKLEAAFNLTAKQIENILDTISYIFEQAAYHVSKPSVLNQQLQTISLNEEKIQCFINTWQENGANVIEMLRKRSLAPKQLETVNWELRLQTAQANKTKMKIPSAILELGLQQSDTEKMEKLQMEFTHEELYKFFQQLENVQSSLDSLNQ